MSSEYQRYPGGLQGALVPRRAAPPDADALELGERVIVLGSDVAGHRARLGDGDVVIVAQVTEQAFGPRVRFYYSLDRRSGLPAGWEWREVVRVGAIEIERPLAGGLPAAQIRHLRDRAIDAAGGLVGDEIGFGLLLRRTDPLAAVPDDVELPGVWLDAVVDDDPGPIWLANRVPEPNMGAVPHSWATLSFEIHRQTLEPFDLTTLELSVAGQVAISGGVLQAPFIGTIDTSDPPVIVVEIDIGALEPASSLPVDVELSVATEGADSLATTWTWIWSDTIAPTILEAGEASPTTIWVWSTEPLADPPGTDFSLAPADGPGYVPEVLAVRRVDATTLALDLDEELTIGRAYTITGSLIDLEGNTTPSSIELLVERYRPPERLVDVYGWFPRQNRIDDSTGGLLFFSRMVQDALERTLTRSGKLGELALPDLIPTRYLPAALLSLGCPWPPDLLTEAQQRRLLGRLVAIYQVAGTVPGLKLAAQTLLGLDPEVRTGAEGSWWVLGQDVLGEGTIIAPGNDDPFWYTFWFDFDDAESLTDEQLEWLARIANTLRGAQEHYGGLFTGVDTIFDFWELGVDTLGEETLLGG